MRVDPLGRLVLRHDSDEDRPSPRSGLLAPRVVDAFGGHGQGFKRISSDRTTTCCTPRSSSSTADCPGQLWFNASIESLGEPRFRELAANYPAAIRQCHRLPRAARVQRPGACEGAAEMLRGSGVNRFSMASGTPQPAGSSTSLERSGHDMNMCGVPDLAAVLPAALLLPRP